MPPAPPPQPKMTDADVTPELLPAPVAKEGEGGAPAAGVTAETGLFSYDLAGRDDDEDEDRQVVMSRKGYITVAQARQAARDAIAAGEISQADLDRWQEILDRQGATEADVAKEMQAFRRFEKGRRRAREWRDFEFRAVAPVRGHNLNDAGRLAIRKDAGQVAVAGLAVLAADTGRVLMLQRALRDDDPAAGTWEFPGGHVEDGESPLRAAWREWSEEAGVAPPPGVQTGSWTSPDGIYQGIVWTADSEASVPVRGDSWIPNPDDPDGDSAEAIAWWSPETIPGNPAVRPELLACIDDVMAALGCAPDDGEPSPGDESTCPCGMPVVYDEGNGWQHGDGSVSHEDGESVSAKMTTIAKAYPDGQSYGSHAFRPTAGYPNVCHYCGVGATDPLHDAYRAVAKAGDGKGPKGWPGWKLDLKAAAHWAPEVTAQARKSLTATALAGIARDYIRDHPAQDGKATGKHDRNDGALAWLGSRGVTVPMGPPADGITADGYAIGAASAHAAVNGQQDAGMGDWEPGDTPGAERVAEELGAAALLAAILGGGSGGSGHGGIDVAGDLGDGYLTVVARVLAGWDPGTAADELAGMLAEAVDDGAYAEALTATQVTVVSGQAALDYYLAGTASLLQWTVTDDARTCARCVTNEQAGPVRAGTPFPSGDLRPPAHSRCRCAIVPEWFLSGG